MNTILKLHLRFNPSNLGTNIPLIKSKPKPTHRFSPSSKSSSAVRSKNPIHNERSLPQEPKSRLFPNVTISSSERSRMVLLGAASFGLAVFLMGFDDHSKALAFGPEGPLMEDFWDNMRRYALYALTVSTGALSALFEPIFELLKNPISAVLIILILGGGFFIVSQVVTAMVGDRGNGERILEGVGVLERDGVSWVHGPTVVDEAVVVVDPPEDLRVDQPSRAEPAAAHVDVGDAAAARQADVVDLDGVGGDPVGEGGRGPLEDEDVFPGATAAHAHAVHPSLVGGGGGGFTSCWITFCFQGTINTAHCNCC